MMTGVGCDRNPSEALFGARLTLEFKVTFQETINPSKYAYVIAFSTDSEFDNTRPSDTDRSRYLPLPGQDIGDGDRDFRTNENEVSSYYAEFYQFWHSYFISKDSTFEHIRSTNDAGFPSANVTEAIHQSFQPDLSAEFTHSLSSPSNVLTVTVIAEKLIETTAISNLQFSIMTFDRETLVGDPGSFLDYNNQNTFIPIPLSGDELLVDQSNANELDETTSIDLDTGSIPIPGPANIISWQVRQF